MSTSRPLGRGPLGRYARTLVRTLQAAGRNIPDIGCQIFGPCGGLPNLVVSITPPYPYLPVSFTHPPTYPQKIFPCGGLPNLVLIFILLPSCISPSHPLSPSALP